MKFSRTELELLKPLFEIKLKEQYNKDENFKLIKEAYNIDSIKTSFLIILKESSEDELRGKLYKVASVVNNKYNKTNNPKEKEFLRSIGQKIKQLLVYNWNPTVAKDVFNSLQRNGLYAENKNETNFLIPKKYVQEAKNFVKKAIEHPGRFKRYCKSKGYDKVNNKCIQKGLKSSDKSLRKAAILARTLSHMRDKKTEE